MNKQKIIDITKTFVGERTDDEAMDFIKNLSEELNTEDDSVSKTEYDSLNKKYNELKKSYKETFFAGVQGKQTEADEIDEIDKNNEYEKEQAKLTIFSAFTEK